MVVTILLGVFQLLLYSVIILNKTVSEGRGSGPFLVTTYYQQCLCVHTIESHPSSRLSSQFYFDVEWSETNVMKIKEAT